MSQLNFEHDYITGAHPEVLQALIEENLRPHIGYGQDEVTARAREIIRRECAAPDAEVIFLAGGTQTNQFVIANLLAPYQGVVAVESGHVATHEAGAIEHAGHKVVTLPEHEGKMRGEDLRALFESFYADDAREHMVEPGLVYISQPTESGTLYSLRELEDLSALCREYEVPLFVDGARLIYALGSPENDVALEDLARLASVFYIGGTKAGTLLGEAIVFDGAVAPSRLLSRVKQKGALLAKGWVVSAQFEALMRDGLYRRIGEKAVAQAKKIAELAHSSGIGLGSDSPTNQQFLRLSEREFQALAEQVAMTVWEKYDDGGVLVRLATTWSTRDEDIEELGELFARLP